MIVTFPVLEAATKLNRVATSRFVVEALVIVALAATKSVEEAKPFANTSKLFTPEEEATAKSLAVWPAKPCNCTVVVATF